MKRVLILLLLLLPSCIAVVIAQTQRVEGTVVLSNDQPAVGAAIVVKGTSIGAVTNIDGKFVIPQVPASAKTLVVYHVNSKTKEIDVSPNVYIVLEPKETGLSWNVKAGVSLFTYRHPDGINEKYGFSAGVGAEYAFTTNWAVQPSVMITSKGTTDESTDEKVYPIYLDIPLLAAFKLPISDNVNFVINAGPYLAIGIGGKYTDEGEGEKTKRNVFSGDKALLKRFDIGFQGGVGFEIYRFLAHISVQHGFINPFKHKENYEMEKNHYPIGGILTVGYKF